MDFTVVYRDDEGFSSKEFDGDARFSIADSGVLTTVTEGKRTQWSPGFWVSVSDDAPQGFVAFSA